MLCSYHLGLVSLTTSDVYEGAESPVIGTVAAISGLVSSVGINTSDFLHRLKKRPQPRVPQESTVKTDMHNNNAGGKSHGEGMSTERMNLLAWKMATKSYDDDLIRNFDQPAENQRLTKVRNKAMAKKAKNGRAHQVASATAHYAGDLTITGLKGRITDLNSDTCSYTLIAPVAFFYNVATGFRNLPSYTIHNDLTRRRDEIKGFGSGINLAGKVRSLVVTSSRFPWLTCRPRNLH